MTFRRRAAALVLMIAVLGLAACSGGDDEISTTQETDDTSATTNAATAEQLVLDVAFLRNGKIALAHRSVAPTQAVGRAALDQLVTGPSTNDGVAFTTAVPTGTRVASLSVDGGVATAELAPAITDPVARAQVVFTLTQFRTVEKVRFGAGGPALGRDDVTDALGPILVESVAPDDSVSSPIRVSGIANTFESNVRLRILGADGRILADTFTTSTGQPGSWSPFEERVTFDRGTDTRGTVMAFTNSAETGAMTGVVEIPVRFGP